jgi:hypothetical protein
MNSLVVISMSMLLCVVAVSMMVVSTEAAVAATATLATTTTTVGSTSTAYGTSDTGTPSFLAVDASSNVYVTETTKAWPNIFVLPSYNGGPWAAAAGNTALTTAISGAITFPGTPTVTGFAINKAGTIAIIGFQGSGAVGASNSPPMLVRCLISASTTPVAGTYTCATLSITGIPSAATAATNGMTKAAAISIDGNQVIYVAQTAATGSAAGVVSVVYKGIGTTNVPLDVTSSTTLSATLTTASSYAFTALPIQATASGNGFIGIVSTHADVDNNLYVLDSNSGTRLTTVYKYTAAQLVTATGVPVTVAVSTAGSTTVVFTAITTDSALNLFVGSGIGQQGVGGTSDYPKIYRFPSVAPYGGLTAAGQIGDLPQFDSVNSLVIDKLTNNMFISNTQSSANGIYTQKQIVPTLAITGGSSVLTVGVGSRTGMTLTLPAALGGAGGAVVYTVTTSFTGAGFKDVLAGTNPMPTFTVPQGSATFEAFYWATAVPGVVTFKFEITSAGTGAGYYVKYDSFYVQIVQQGKLTITPATPDSFYGVPTNFAIGLATADNAAGAVTATATCPVSFFVSNTNAGGAVANSVNAYTFTSTVAGQESSPTTQSSATPFTFSNTATAAKLIFTPTIAIFTGSLPMALTVVWKAVDKTPALVSAGCYSNDGRYIFLQPAAPAVATIRQGLSIVTPQSFATSSVTWAFTMSPALAAGVTVTVTITEASAGGGYAPFGGTVQATAPAGGAAAGSSATLTFSSTQSTGTFTYVAPNTIATGNAPKFIFTYATTAGTFDSSAIYLTTTTTSGQQSAGTVGTPFVPGTTGQPAATDPKVFFAPTAGGANLVNTFILPTYSIPFSVYPGGAQTTPNVIAATSQPNVFASGGTSGIFVVALATAPTGTINLALADASTTANGQVQIAANTGTNATPSCGAFSAAPELATAGAVPKAFQISLTAAAYSVCIKYVAHANFAGHLDLNAVTSWGQFGANQVSTGGAFVGTPPANIAFVQQSPGTANTWAKIIVQSQIKITAAGPALFTGTGAPATALSTGANTFNLAFAPAVTGFVATLTLTAGKITAVGGTGVTPIGGAITGAGVITVAISVPAGTSAATVTYLANNNAGTGLALGTADSLTVAVATSAQTGYLTSLDSVGILNNPTIPIIINPSSAFAFNVVGVLALTAAPASNIYVGYDYKLNFQSFPPIAAGNGATIYATDSVQAGAAPATATFVLATTGSPIIPTGPASIGTWKVGGTAFGATSGLALPAASVHTVLYNVPASAAVNTVTASKQKIGPGGNPLAYFYVVGNYVFSNRESTANALITVTPAAAAPANSIVSPAALALDFRVLALTLPAVYGTISFAAPTSRPADAAAASPVGPALVTYSVTAAPPNPVTNTAITTLPAVLVPTNFIMRGATDTAGWVANAAVTGGGTALNVGIAFALTTVNTGAVTANYPFYALATATAPMEFQVIQDAGTVGNIDNYAFCIPKATALAPNAGSECGPILAVGSVATTAKFTFNPTKDLVVTGLPLAFKSGAALADATVISVIGPANAGLPASAAGAIVASATCGVIVAPVTTCGTFYSGASSTVATAYTPIPTTGVQGAGGATPTYIAFVPSAGITLGTSFVITITGATAAASAVYTTYTTATGIPLAGGMTIGPASGAGMITNGKTWVIGTSYDITPILNPGSTGVSISVTDGASAGSFRLSYTIPANGGNAAQNVITPPVNGIVQINMGCPAISGTTLCTADLQTRPTFLTTFGVYVAVGVNYMPLQMKPITLSANGLGYAAGPYTGLVVGSLGWFSNGVPVPLVGGVPTLTAIGGQPVALALNLLGNQRAFQGFAVGIQDMIGPVSTVAPLVPANPTTGGGTTAGGSFIFANSFGVMGASMTSPVSGTALTAGGLAVTFEAGMGGVGILYTPVASGTILIAQAAVPTGSDATLVTVAGGVTPSVPLLTIVVSGSGAAIVSGLPSSLVTGQPVQFTVSINPPLTGGQSLTVAVADTLGGEFKSGDPTKPNTFTFTTTISSVQFNYKTTAPPGTTAAISVLLSGANAGSSGYVVLPVPGAGGMAGSVGTTAALSQTFNIAVIAQPMVQGVMFNAISDLNKYTTRAGGNAAFLAPATYSTFNSEIATAPALNFNPAFNPGKVSTPAAVAKFTAMVPAGTQAVVVDVAFSNGNLVVQGPAGAVTQTYSLPSPTGGFVTPPIMLEPGVNLIKVVSGVPVVTGGVTTGYTGGDGEYWFEIIRSGVFNVGVAVHSVQYSEAGANLIASSFMNSPAGVVAPGSTIMLPTFNGGSGGGINFGSLYSLTLPIEADIVVPYVVGVGNGYFYQIGKASGLTDWYAPVPVNMNSINIPPNPKVMPGQNMKVALNLAAGTLTVVDNTQNFQITGGPENIFVKVALYRQKAGVIQHNIPQFLCAASSYRFVMGFNTPVTTGTVGCATTACNAITVTAAGASHTTWSAASGVIAPATAALGGVNYPDNVFELTTGAAEKFPIVITYTPGTAVRVMGQAGAPAATTITVNWGGC